MCILHQIVAGLGSIISGIVHTKKTDNRSCKIRFQLKDFPQLYCTIGSNSYEVGFYSFFYLKSPHLYHSFSWYMMWSSDGFTNLVFTNPKMFSPTFSSKLIYVYQKGKTFLEKNNRQFRICEDKVLETILLEDSNFWK